MATPLPTARAILKTFITSLVPINRGMHSRSCDFLYRHIEMSANTSFLSLCYCLFRRKAFGYNPLYTIDAIYSQTSYYLIVWNIKCGIVNEYSSLIHDCNKKPFLKLSALVLYRRYINLKANLKSDFLNCILYFCISLHNFSVMRLNTAFFMDEYFSK